MQKTKTKMTLPKSETPLLTAQLRLEIPSKTLTRQMQLDKTQACCNNPMFPGTLVVEHDAMDVLEGAGISLGALLLSHFLERDKKSVGLVLVGEQKGRRFRESVYLIAERRVIVLTKFASLEEAGGTKYCTFIHI